MSRFLIRPGVVIGVGMGGLLDRILLQEILGGHDSLAGWRISRAFAEGWPAKLLPGGLHALLWLTTALGVAMLWGAAGRGAIWSTPAFAGALLAGFSGYLVVESLLNHHLLGVHHVQGPGGAGGDVLFLAWGAIIGLGGWALMRLARNYVVSPASSS